MENLETLSDDQIRVRLHQFGLPIMPITDTTRKVLLKKLKSAMDGQNIKTRRDTVAVTKFSSDEEPEQSKNREKVSNRRATIAATTVKSKKSINGTTIDTASKPISKARTTPIEKTTINFDDSDDDVILVPGPRRSKTPTLVKSDMIRTSFKNAGKEVLVESQEDSNDEAMLPPRKATPVIPEISSIRRKTVTSGFSSTLQERSTPTNIGRTTLTTSFNPRGNYTFDDEESDGVDINEENQYPYLSNFAKRLSTLRAEPLDAGLEKYQSKLRAPGKSTDYNAQHQPTRYNDRLPPTQKAHKPGGVMKSLGQVFDSLDDQYNFRKILYIVLIVMIIVAIYVVVM